MEVYILDSLLRRERVIDRFESLIWTERFQDEGDFELTIRSTNESRSLLKTGVRLAMSESYRVMTVETVENGVTEDGLAVLEVSGISLESILRDRTAWLALEDTTTTTKWLLSGPPATVARGIFYDICVEGSLSIYDKIPFINVNSSLMPQDTIVEPIDPIQLALDIKTVYDNIKEICDVWNLGFRLLRNFDRSELWFDIYSGSDRTAGQSILDPVIFSPDLDNLKNPKELTSVKDSKNVAYVFSPVGFLEVYPPDIDPEIEGFERRVLAVKADDINAETPDIPAALLQRGLEELSKHRTFQMFDGQISENSQYKYGRDYFLGDLVEMRNIDGVSNQMRVTEQIFVSDESGERIYPTLTMNKFVNTGSWLSWQSNRTWVDYENDPTTWAEQP